MKWVDEETYVGVCRRITERPVLLQRRRRNRARPAPPSTERLFAQLAQAEPSTRNRLRLQAAIDLAHRLDDPPMERAFRKLEQAMTGHLGVNVIAV